MRLGDHEVVTGGAPIILPDIGTFFNQDMGIARKLVDTVAASGCRYIKGEILHSADVCLPGEAVEPYYNGVDGFMEENYRQLIERKVVPLESYREIFRYARSLGLELVVSVYDFEGVDFAVAEGVCALKIASSNVVHNPLITYAAKTGLPLILDTGRANMDEISRAVQWARDAGCEALAVEHSPSAPPAPLDQQRLPMMLRLASAFDAVPGLSDHHAGEEMMYAAVAMGVPILEKGLCPDDAAIDQDVHHALPVSMLKEVVQKCRNIHEAMNFSLRMIPEEKKKRTDRMCVVAGKDLKQGDALSLDGVRFAFPQVGIPVEMWETAQGMELLYDIPEGTPIRWQDVGFPA